MRKIPNSIAEKMKSIPSPIKYLIHNDLVEVYDVRRFNAGLEWETYKKILKIKDDGE